ICLALEPLATTGSTHGHRRPRRPDRPDRPRTGDRPPMTDKPNHPAPDLAALRDDLTHALGSDHLADLALRAVEPALLAVEIDTAQRMQDDVDRERQRAALLREQVRDLKAQRDAHERQLREQIARDIEETADADVIGPYEAGLDRAARVARRRSEEHTSELQSR